MRPFCKSILFKIRSVLMYCSGYNPPKFVTDAAKEALDKVECNQYSPTKVSLIEQVIISPNALK